MKPSSEPGRMLVVDDNRVNWLLLTHALEQNGHHVSTAENGRIGMQMLKSQTFDVILLDIDMPEMNGFEVLEALLQDNDLRDLPVIMTSASDELDRVVKCIEMGAEDYLVKPLNPVLLRARVNASLEKKTPARSTTAVVPHFCHTRSGGAVAAGGVFLGGKYVTASVMFADIRSFTTLSENQEPTDTIELLNSYFALMFDAITSNYGTVNQMEGDGMMAIFGAPVYDENHREHAARAALEMIELLNAFNEQRAMQKKRQIDIGIGIATGQGDRRVYRHTTPRHLYLRGGYGQPCRAHPGLYEGRLKNNPSCWITIRAKACLMMFPWRIWARSLFKGKQQPIHVYSIAL